MRGIKRVVLAGSLCLSAAVSAEAPFYGVPVFDDGRPLARHDDELPAVMSYYLKQPAQQVIKQYIDAMGTPSKQSHHGKRTELHYLDGKEVVITVSAQDHWSQIDILVRQQP